MLEYRFFEDFRNSFEGRSSSQKILRLTSILENILMALEKKIPPVYPLRLLESWAKNASSQQELTSGIPAFIGIFCVPLWRQRHNMNL